MVNDTAEWYKRHMKQHAYLLRAGEVYERRDDYSTLGRWVWRWFIVDGATGHTVKTWPDATQARSWLLSCGYTHTTDSAGEAHAEVWTR